MIKRLPGHFKKMCYKPGLWHQELSNVIYATSFWFSWNRFAWCRSLCQLFSHFMTNLLQCLWSMLLSDFFFFFSSYISLWIALSSLYLYQSEPQQAEALESRCPWLFMNAWIISFMHKGMFWEPSSFPTICFNVCMPDASYFFQPSCLHPSFHPMVVREYQLSLVQLY